MKAGMFDHLGTALRTIRESAGLAQAEVARRAGLGKSQLSKYENGKELPKLETLERILEVLGAEPLTVFYTAHVLKCCPEISPTAMIGLSLSTPGPLLDDPALESLRRLFGHFLETFEILVKARVLGRE